MQKIRHAFLFAAHHMTDRFFVDLAFTQKQVVDGLTIDHGGVQLKFQRVIDVLLQQLT